MGQFVHGVAEVTGTGGEGAHHTEMGLQAGARICCPCPSCCTKPPCQERGCGAGGHGNPSAWLQTETLPHRWACQQVAGVMGVAAGGRPGGLQRHQASKGCPPPLLTSIPLRKSPKAAA